VPIRANDSRRDLAAQLHQLETAQLVRRESEEELVYIFKHVFTQEAAYGSLLHQQRRVIHRQVAETFERMNRDRLDEYAALLALHYEQAGDNAKTLEYSVRAGDAAARTYAHAEAIAQYTRALQVALHSDAAAAMLARIFVQRGRAFELASDYKHALANYEEMEQQARKRGDRSLELQARLCRATVYVVGGTVTDFAQAHALAEDALQLARDLGDKPAEAKAYWNLLIANRFGNQGIIRAIEYGEQSAAIARKAGLNEQLAFALHDLGLAYLAMKQYDRALANLNEAIPLWRALDNQPLLTDAMSSIGAIHYSSAELDQARRYAEDAYALNYAIGNAYGLVSDTGLLAGVHIELGQLKQAQEFFAECEGYGRQAGAMFITALLRIEAATFYGEVGAWERAQTLAQHALGFFEAAMPSQRARAVTVLAGIRLAQGDFAGADTMMIDVPRAMYDDYVQWYSVGTTPEALLMLLSEMALAHGDVAAAARLADDLLSGVERTQTRLRLPAALNLKAKVLRVQNRLDEARAHLIRARAEALAIGKRRHLWTILVALSEVETELGHAEASQAARAQAREVIEYIAAHMPEDSRHSFVSLAAVRQILASA
jgi:tetratricopeptide (TPR) repeat protein